MRQRLLTGLRAASIAFLILLNWAAMPVLLTVGEQDSCAMVCCVEDGFCCCNPARPSVQKIASDDRDFINNAHLDAPCPRDCAQAGVSSSSFLRVAVRPAGPQLKLFCAVEDISPPITFGHEEIEPGPCSPRSPPYPAI